MNEPELKRCPICGKPIGASASQKASEHAPFCSSRCKDRDLARWFGDAYAVPGPPASSEDIERALREEDR